MAHTAEISAVLGTWRLQSYVREVLATGERFNQFGEDPDGYIGYAPDDRMDAIFTRKDRITPADTVPTEEEGVELLGTMVAYAGTFTLEAEKVTHHCVARVGIAGALAPPPSGVKRCGRNSGVPAPACGSGPGPPRPSQSPDARPYASAARPRSRA